MTDILSSIVRYKRDEIAADLRMETRFPDQGGGDGCVTTSGRENDGPLG